MGNVAVQFEIDADRRVMVGDVVVAGAGDMAVVEALEQDISYLRFCEAVERKEEQQP